MVEYPTLISFSNIDFYPLQGNLRREYFAEEGFRALLARSHQHRVGAKL